MVRSTNVMIFTVLFCASAAVSAPLLTPRNPSRFGRVHIRGNPDTSKLENVLPRRLHYRQWIACLDTTETRGCSTKAIIDKNGDRHDWYRVRYSDKKEGWILADVVEPFEIPFEVRFLDLGAGSAAIITIDGKSIVVDGGPDPQILGRYIQQHGLSPDVRIVIVTSVDITHHNALADHVGTWRPQEFWGPRQCRNAPAYEHFLARLPQNTVRHCDDGTCEATQHFTSQSIPAIDILVLDAGTCEDKRESLVVRIDIGRERLLFTGDMQGKEPSIDAHMNPRDAEGRVLELARAEDGKGGLVRRYIFREDGPLRADVLVVPDHGSNHASTIPFVNLVHPRYAIIGGGESNALSNSVLERYHQFDATVLCMNMERGENKDVRCSHSGGRPIQCTFEQRSGW